MTINQIEYGNPSIDTLQLINAHSFLDILFADLTGPQYAWPLNDSDFTKKELNDICYQNGILQTDVSALERYQRYDASLISFYTDVRFDSKEETEAYQKLLLSLFEDTLPTIFKLKHHYQRPRPYQLAHYYKLKLFPFHSQTADSAAYPCAHACISQVIATVFSKHYENATKYWHDTAFDVGASRIYMGLNYQSSVDFGKLVANKIVANADFEKKYKL